MERKFATIALCSASPIAARAATALLSLNGAAAPDWVELMPAGDVKPNDGREVWKNPGADEIIKASKLPFAIDYDHATDRKIEDGAVSRASGWVEELQNRNGAIWGRVDWTDAGAKAVASKEYRYLSPVFTFDKATRKIGALLRAALVNNPALPQLTALASQQETSLNEDVQKIAKALGLPETATCADVLAKINSITGASNALASAQKFLGSIATAAGLTVAADKIGETEVTALCTKLKAPAATGDQVTIDNLQKEVATLSAKLAGQTASQEVEKAIAAGKLPPAQKQWAIDYCSRDAEGFAKFIAGQPVIASGDKTAPSKPAEGELSETEKAVCAQLGIKPDDYKATAKAMKETA